MQLGSIPPLPTPAAAAPPAAQAYSADSLIPAEMAAVQVGDRTVREEIDRSIRIRLDGSGPASQRALVPDSKAATDLLASPDGATFENAMRAMLTVADPHEGKENLKTITFLPDEHASKGVRILNWASNLHANGTDPNEAIEPSAADVADAHKHVPSWTPEQIHKEMRLATAKGGVEALIKGEESKIKFAGAWNGGGNIVMTPDVSRNMMATLGLYRIQPDDTLAQLPAADREAKARWSWHVALHEAHHSITPARKGGSPEWTRVMEEAVSEVLAPGAVHATMKAAQGDLSLVSRSPAAGTGEGLDWAAWNRDHLPQPPADKAATAKGRYTDGPKLVQELLRMSNIDRRTTEGKAQALDLLQGENSSRVPRRIADALVGAHGLPPERAPKVADLIRKASIGGTNVAEIRRYLEQETA